MSWADVFRRDLRSVYRSRLGYSVAITFVVLTAGIGAVINYTSNPRYPPEMGQMVVIFGSLLSFLVPLVALMATYSAIVGERTTGSVRFLLGLPNSRTDVYVGKFLSRTVVVVGPLVAGTLLAGVLVVPVAENGAFGPFVALALLASWYAVIFVGIGLAASAYADTDTRAVTLVVGVFALLRAGWPALQWAGLQGLEERVPRPEWYFWLGRLNPMNAFNRVTMLLTDVEEHPLITVPYTPPERGRFVGELPRESVAGQFVVSAEFALLVLVVATFVTPLAGYLYFRQRDML